MAMNTSQDQVLVLLEEIAQLNKNLSAENRSLADEMKKRDEANSKALKDIQQNLDQTCASRTESRTRRRAKAVRVPAPCRRITKQLYKTLCKSDDFEGFKVIESVHSNHNKIVIDSVVSELHRQYEGEEKSPWCRMLIETVLRRYFISVYEREKQTREGKYETHKKNCRKSARKRDKLIRRTVALERINWSTRKRGRVANVLVEDAMSSEDSCTEDNPGPKVVSYARKRLSWESDRLTKAKKALDCAYNSNLTPRAKQRILPRHDADHPSTRTVPVNFPTWALSK